MWNVTGTPTPDDWNVEGRPVRGHLCDGLKRFQQRVDYEGQTGGGSCIPIFSHDGKTMGCDDTNYEMILFCPFCGIELPAPTEADRKKRNFEEEL